MCERLVEMYSSGEQTGYVRTTALAKCSCSVAEAAQVAARISRRNSAKDMRKYFGNTRRAVLIKRMQAQMTAAKQGDTQGIRRSMSVMLKRFVCIVAFFLLAAPLDVSAQDYPSRPITVVVPFPAGGPSDVVARIVTEEMGKILGQSMIIENIGGAGGTIGSARVAAANPDGYTLLAGSMGSHVAAPVLTPNVKYDSERDFEPIGFTAHAPAVVVANRDFPAKDLRDFVGYLKKHGESVKQAYGGIGSSSHMACLLFASAAGVRPTLVAYRGTGPALYDLICVDVDYFCEQAVSVAMQITSGTIKAYGVSSSQRLVALPDVPTAKEAGVDYQMSIWAGIFAPKGTPKPIIDKLAAALDQALDDPGVQSRLTGLGGSLPSKDERAPAKFNEFVKAEIARWSPILKAANTEGK